MSLLDEVLKESRKPVEGGIYGALKQWEEENLTVNGLTTADYESYLDWINSMMTPSALDRAVKEITVEDMGIYKYAAVDKDGNPVAFYGESFRNAAMKYVEENP